MDSKIDANILIIDDELPSIQQIKELLGRFGYSSRGLTNAKFLFQLLDDEPIDLILMDINMPNEDGITLLRRLKAHPAYQSIPVIMLTSVEEKRILKECFDVGSVDYINKPPDETILHARIKSALTTQDYIKRLEKEIIERQRSEKKRAQLEAQLRHTQKMKAVGTLASGIAHDFNNILFAILGNAELLLQDLYAEDTEGLDYVKSIIRSGERAKKVVAQLTNFASYKEKSFSPTQIITIVKQALEMVRISFPANIEIQQSLNPDCPPILADSSQIYQSIINICMNAKEAMEDKGGILELVLDTAEFEKPPSNLPGLQPGKLYVHLKIRDTGCGMSPEVREQIFDPFFTTKGLGGTNLGPSKEGTGLGLSVVYNIVHNHKGAITVESKQTSGDSNEDTHSGGTIFHLYFPVADEKIPEEESSPLEKEFNQMSQRKIHVLLVEDEDPLVKFYKAVISKAGYQVTSCYNGEEALETFREHPDMFDLVMTDQEMPKLTGIQLSKALLNIRPDIPIILATGYSEIINEDNFSSFGVHNFLLKPISSNKLLRTIESVFHIPEK